MTRLLALSAVAFLTVTAAAHAEESCRISGPMMSRDAITKSLHDRGFTQIRGLSAHNGCWEAKGIDSKGQRFELELNGETGAIMNRE